MHLPAHKISDRLVQQFPRSESGSRTCAGVNMYIVYCVQCCQYQCMKLCSQLQVNQATTFGDIDHPMWGHQFTPPFAFVTCSRAYRWDRRHGVPNSESWFPFLSTHRFWYPQLATFSKTMLLTAGPHEGIILHPFCLCHALTCISVGCELRNWQIVEAGFIQDYFTNKVCSLGKNWSLSDVTELF